MVAALVMLALPGCNQDDLIETYQPAEWRALFAAADGWVALPIPDSAYEAGAIIKVPPESAPRYVSHLRTCRYPDEILALVPGVVPDVQFSKAREFGANAVLNIQGISAGPAFDHVAKVRMTVADAEAVKLDMLRLQIWEEEDPAHVDAVPAACRALLEQPDHYVVSEAFRVGRSRYEFFDRNGARLEMDLGKIREFLTFTPEFAYAVTDEGALIVDEPVTIAVRRVVRFDGGWNVLGEPSADEETADARLDAVYQEMAME